MADFESTYQSILDAIRQDPENAVYTDQGWEPMIGVYPEATTVIIGQAPSRRVQERGVMWDDQSGDRLREWLGIDRPTFYDSHKISIIPMDFYFPGKDKNGGDKLPRNSMAPKYHEQLLALMPNLKAYILVGNTAVHYYLNLKRTDKLTDAVKEAEIPSQVTDIAVKVALPHPSPRNNIWLAKNEWFAEEKLPALQKLMKNLLK